MYLIVVFLLLLLLLTVPRCRAAIKASSRYFVSVARRSQAGRVQTSTPKPQCSRETEDGKPGIPCVLEFCTHTLTGRIPSSNLKETAKSDPCQAPNPQTLWPFGGFVKLLSWPVPGIGRRSRMYPLTICGSASNRVPAQVPSAVPWRSSFLGVLSCDFSCLPGALRKLCVTWQLRGSRKRCRSPQI